MKVVMVVGKYATNQANPLSTRQSRQGGSPNSFCLCSSGTSRHSRRQYRGLEERKEMKEGFGKKL